MCRMGVDSGYKLFYIGSSQPTDGSDRSYQSINLHLYHDPQAQQHKTNEKQKIKYTNSNKKMKWIIIIIIIIY